jgi:hypothetical protein
VNDRSSAQNLWRAARDGIARLNQFLAGGDSADDAVFQAPSRETKRTDEAQRRIAAARKARIRN